MKKITTKLFGFFMAITILCCFGLRVEAATENKLQVKTAIGFNDNYKIGFSAPITLTINNKYKDIQGEVEIRIPSATGKYISYVKTLNMQKDSEKVITINVPIDGQRTKYKLFINNGSEVVYEDTISINNTMNNVTKFIGVLSDDFDSLSYINKVPDPIGISLLTKTIKLDEKNLPNDFFSFKAFDIIIINNYDTSKLSKDQYKVLKQWVMDGGTLIVGTGVNHSKTLGIFKDDFIQGNIFDVKKINTSKIYNLATNGDNNNGVNLDVLSIDVKDGKTILEDNGVKLVQTISKGKGVAALVAFDLGQPPFIGWNNNTNFSVKLMGIVNPNLSAMNDVNVKNMGQQDLAYGANEALNLFSEIASARPSSFYLILFIYVLVVAPLSYIVLKKIDKRELMWVTVPIIAVIFGFIVFLSGSNTRLREITTNMFSTISMDMEGKATVNTYAGVFSPKKMKLKVESKNGEKLIPIIQQYNGDPATQTTDNSDMEAKIYTDEKSSVEFVNSSIFETKTIQIQGETTNIGKIESNINVVNGILKGTIKNSTNIDLIDCYLVTQGEYYKIDEIKSGETKELPSKAETYSGNIQEFSYTVVGNNNNQVNPATLSDSERNKYIDNQQEAAMTRMMFNMGNQSLQGFNLIAFSKTPIHNSLIVNGSETMKNERVVLFTPLNINFKNGDIVEYPKGFIPYTVGNAIGLQYNSGNNTFYSNGNGKGTAEIEYSIDKTINLENVEVDIKNIISSGQTKPIVYIYNLDKKNYDELKTETIKDDLLKKYITKENKLNLKIEIKENDCSIPKISARGKVK